VRGPIELAEQTHLWVGPLKPGVEPGRYDWSTLDYYVELIRSAGGTPAITFRCCCAPDWIKGGRPGEAGWRRLEELLLAQHYDDFAAFAAIVARRYRDVRQFRVRMNSSGSGTAGTARAIRDCSAWSTTRSRPSTRGCRSTARA
jgi:hypothetical protein